MTKEKPKVYIEDAQPLTAEGISKICNPEEKPLNEMRKQIHELIEGKKYCLDDWIYPENDVIQKLKRIQERLREEIDNWMRDLGIFDSAELVNIPDVMDLKNRITKVFEEEVGEN